MLLIWSCCWYAFTHLSSLNAIIGRKHFDPNQKTFKTVFFLKFWNFNGLKHDLY